MTQAVLTTLTFDQYLHYSDYLGLGAARYIGLSKGPTLSVYRLVNGEYQVSQFRGSDPIVSPTFFELALTAEQVFRGAR